MLTIVCPVLYVIDIALLVVYFVYVFRKYGYLLSLFNIGLIQFYATILLSPWYYFSDASWGRLNVESAVPMRPYLLKSMLINYGGTLIFMAVLLICVWKLGDTWKAGKLTRRISDAIDARVAAWLIVGAAAVFTFICFRYNGAFPLLNHDRDFYLNKGYSSIYLLACQILSSLGLYEGLRFVTTRKGLLWFLVCVACQLLTGNRGTVLLGIILPVVLYGLYLYGLKKDGLRGLKRQTVVALLAVVVIAGGGIAMQFARRGDVASSVNEVVEEIVNGNTFCDVRDGAYLLKGHHERLKDEFVMGKTYAAGLISFIPSSMSPFRMEWSWGRFSSLKLSKWKHHLGFRGGNYLEAYVNFGYAGVVVVAVLTALILALQEQLFRKIFLDGHETVTGKEIFVCSILGGIGSFLACSSGMYNTYALMGLVVLMMILSKIVRHFFGPEEGADEKTTAKAPKHFAA